MRLPVFLLSALIACLLATFDTSYAVAQDLPPLGAEATLDVGSWNVVWFGDDVEGPEDSTQYRNVRRVLRSAAVDLWALQEISDTDDFNRLVADLGPNYAGRLSTYSQPQKTGFLWNTDVISLRSITPILEQYATAPTDWFAGRPPLQLIADVTLPDTSLRIAFIVVHLKAGQTAEDYDRRKKSAEVLKNRLDYLPPSGVDGIMVLGDYNDELLSAIRAGEPSPFAGFVADPKYTFTTLELERAGINTHCSNRACSAGTTRDHILISRKLQPFYVTGSTRSYREAIDGIDVFINTTSDHLPVVSRFASSRASGSESPADIGGFVVSAPYPNPARESVSFSIGSPGALPIELSVYDLLGRRLIRQSFAAGTQMITQALSGLSSGVYLAEVQSGSEVRRFSFVVQ